MTFTTDMPVGAAGRWILDIADQMDKKMVNEILELQTIKYQLKILLQKTGKGTTAEIIKQLDVIDAELNDKRKGLLFYHEASSLDNIHALGLDYIKQQIRDTTQFQFDTQILNLRPLKLEDGFYPDFEEEYHGYFSEHESYFDNIEFQNKLTLDCRKDKDLNVNKPLHIAIDYNRRIHPIVIGQDDGREIKALNGIHALYPGKLKEALELFIEYYKYHKRKLVYYWYDHTAVGGENETEKYSDVMAALRKAGWVVVPMYIGKAPGHEAKYRMWGHLLQEDGKYKRKFRINRENCSKLIISICMAQAEQRKDGFGKDKKSEHDKNFPAEESTHYSDALDMLIFGMLETDLVYGIDSKGGGGMMMK